MATPQERENRANDLPFVIPLTVSAIQDIQFAQQEAKTLNHRFIGTEHLLLALIRNQLIKDTFLKFDIDPNSIPLLVERIAGNRVRQFPAEIDFSLRFKEVVKLATKETNASFQQEVTQVDLLIGIVREQHGVGARILESLGLTENNLPEFRNTYMTLKEEKSDRRYNSDMGSA